MLDPASRAAANAQRTTFPARGESDRLDIEVGLCTRTGKRERNEDYAGVYLGAPRERATIGVIAALADGMGGAKGGRVAAELSVRSFIEDLVSEASARGVRFAGARSLEAINRWTHAIGRADAELQDMGSTFTGLVLRGRQAHVLHVGDCRLYRLRDGRITRLTNDHTLRGVGRNHILTRAIGSASSLQIDYLKEEARTHDRYLLCSDGVHGVLPDRALEEALARRTSPEETASHIIDAATDARSADNMTAIVLDVLGLPVANLADLQREAYGLPIIPTPCAGERVDDFSLVEILADGPYGRVFRGLDETNGQQIVVKLPKPSVAGDSALRQAFLRESWIATRIASPFVGECIEVAASRRSCLYTVMPFYEGETLERRLNQSPPIRIASGLQIAINLARGVAALHRAGVIHRDIKPENVILQSKGGLKLVDLGVARLPHLEDVAEATAPGTPSFIAPELFAGAPGDELSDQFAIGVTIFRMFTGAYPYGEMEPFSRPRFGRPAALSKLRPDLPAWIDRAVSRASALKREDRFNDVVELIYELEHGADRASPTADVRLPLYERNPLTFWKTVSALLAIALIAAVVALQRS